MLLRILSAFLLGALAACTVESAAPHLTVPAQGISVTTDAAKVIEATDAVSALCASPQGGDACGCLVNGEPSLCDLAFQCLGAGDCALARSTPEIVNVKAQDISYKAATQKLGRYCAFPAEYWRCECSIDGIKANCALARSCLDAGFCVKVSNELSQHPVE